MSDRTRDEQETRNTAEAMAWVEHLATHTDIRVEILALQRILDEQRDAYISTLREADQGDLNAWLRFFASAVHRALQDEINQAQERAGPVKDRLDE